MLLGVAVKNSILLVDYAGQLISRRNGPRTSRLSNPEKRGFVRSLMTTMALIAGSLPIAMGLNEASKQRTSMGFAIIGGLISSTVLTLFVVPAAFSYVDRFRVWSSGILGRIFMAEHREGPEASRATDSPEQEGKSEKVASVH